MVRFLLITAVCALSAGCAVEAPSGEQEVASAEQAWTIGYAWPSCFNISSGTLDPEKEVDGAWSGFKNGCVSHRVELNVPGGAGTWASEEIVAHFPEHTGAWTQENIDKCRNSKVRVWYAEKANSGSATYSTIKYAEVPAEPDFHADGYNYSIEGCTAVWRRAPDSCGWNVTNDRDYVRVDAETYSNGVRSSNPLYSSITKYVSCGSL